MGRMKERFMDVVEYAEDCCGGSLSKKEAWEMFSMAYPEDNEIFEDAWVRWVEFAKHMVEESKR